jgi:hypothetical protein
MYKNFQVSCGQFLKKQQMNVLLLKDLFFDDSSTPVYILFFIYHFIYFQSGALWN